MIATPATKWVLALSMVGLGLLLAATASVQIAIVSNTWRPENIDVVAGLQIACLAGPIVIGSFAFIFAMVNDWRSDTLLTMDKEFILANLGALARVLLVQVFTVTLVSLYWTNTREAPVLTYSVATEIWTMSSKYADFQYYIMNAVNVGLNVLSIEIVASALISKFMKSSSKKKIVSREFKERSPSLF